MCRQCFETGPEIVKNLTEYINENMIFKSDYRDWKLCGGESRVRAEGHTFELPQIKAFTASDGEWDLAALPWHRAEGSIHVGGHITAISIFAACTINSIFIFKIFFILRKGMLTLC